MYYTSQNTIEMKTASEKMIDDSGIFDFNVDLKVYL